MVATSKPARGTRTRGGFELARSGKTQVKIATDVGVSKVTVSQWISGDKRPGPPSRRKMRELYGIDPAWWDEKPVKASPAAARAPGRSAPS